MKAVQKLVEIFMALQNAVWALLVTDSLDLATVKKYKARLLSRQPSWFDYVLAFLIQILFIFVESHLRYR